MYLTFVYYNVDIKLIKIRLLRENGKKEEEGDDE